MSNTLNDIKDVSDDLGRRLATRQLKAIQEYSDDLQQYADGKTDIAEFGKRMLNLSLREWTRNAQDAFKLGVTFYTSLFSLAGIKMSESATKRSQPTDKPHSEQPRKRRSTPKS